MKVVWDGQLVEAHEAVIPVQEPGSAFGWGVFETLRIRHGRPCFYRDHFNRLKEGAAIIGMPFNWTGEEMLALTKRVLEANCIEEGAVKWIWLRDHEGPRLWMGPRPGTLAYLRKNEGLVLGRAKGRRNPHSALTYLKTNNWLENSLELTRARLEGWDECLFLNHRGQLCEGAMSNIFFFKEDKLCTPALECGLLPGIMRRKVMEEASRIGWEVE